MRKTKRIGGVRPRRAPIRRKGKQKKRTVRIGEWDFVVRVLKMRNPDVPLRDAVVRFYLPVPYPGTDKRYFDVSKKVDRDGYAKFTMPERYRKSFKRVFFDVYYIGKKRYSGVVEKGKIKEVLVVP